MPNKESVAAIDVSDSIASKVLINAAKYSVLDSLPPCCFIISVTARPTQLTFPYATVISIENDF